MNDEWREFLFANCDLFKNITELYNALKDEFSDCDVCYSTVTRVIRSRSWRVVKEEAHSKRGRPRDSNISRAIQSVLEQRFVLHMDNAPIHTADTVKTCLAMYNIVLAPHPPYSPDLAPSDFCLFGKLKELARGCEFETVEDIKNWILRQFEEISMDELRRVYSSWEDRLVRCISLNGGYIYCSFISYV